MILFFSIALLITTVVAWAIVHPLFTKQNVQLKSQNKPKINGIIIIICLLGLSSQLYLYWGDINWMADSQLFDKLRHDQPLSHLENEALQQKLTEKLRNEPENAQLWMWSARVAMTMKKHSKAAEIYSKIAQLVPNNPDVLATLAQAHYLAAKSTRTEAFNNALNQALSIAPLHNEALSLQAISATQAGDYALAAAAFEKMIATRPPGSEAAVLLTQALERARARAMAGPVAAASALTAEDISLSINIKLADSIKSQINPDDTIFIYVKDKSRPMPIAAQKVPVSALNKTHKIDRSAALMPQRFLSKGQRVIIGARVSKTGTAIKRSGDIYGEAVDFEIAPGVNSVNVIIDTTVN